MSDKKVEYTGLGICDVLGIVFIVLKLLHVINWSWWWVTAPFWGSIAFILAIAFIVFIAGCVFELLKK